MPPKVKISKEDIVTAAVQIVRAEGAEALNARNIAQALHCSTQPIFSNFATMDALRRAVIERADALCQIYYQTEMEKKEFPAYKAKGMGYIRFAKEEKELFKLLFMRDRTGEDSCIEDSETEAIVKDNTGLDEPLVKLFHLEMWAFVHGIAAMSATGFLNLERPLISQMLTDTYNGLRKQYGIEE